jgi:peroxiredoxin
VVTYFRAQGPADRAGCHNTDPNCREYRPGALPLPATFVIAQDRRIALAYVDVDYRRRLAAEDIVATLRLLAGRTAGRA